MPAAVFQGLTQQVTLYQQQASVAAAKAALVSAQRNWEQAKLDLVQTLQLDAKRDYNFVASAVAVNSRPVDDVAMLIERALTHRTDLRSHAVQVHAAQQSVRVANSASLPTVSLSAGYHSGASSVSELSLERQLDERRGGSVSVSVSIPVFDRSTGIAEQQAQIQQKNAEIRLVAQREAVAVEVRRAYLDYQTAREQLAAADAQLKAAELALESTRKRYRAGVSTLVEVTQARAAQVQAASAVVRARYALALQRTLIDSLHGCARAGADVLWMSTHWRSPTSWWYGSSGTRGYTGRAAQIHEYGHVSMTR